MMHALAALSGEWPWILMAGLSGLVLLLLFRRPRTRTPRQAAEHILEQQKAVYGGRHEFCEVSPRDFPGLDLTHYDATRDALARKGFRVLGDIEDLTLSRQFPALRTFVRVLAGPDGTVSAGIYNIRLRGFQRVLQIFGSLPRDLRTVGFETALDDGTFVGTSNALGADRTGDVPGILRFQLPRGTPAAEILARHEASVREALAARPGASPRRVASLNDALEIQHHVQELKNAHRQSMGYMDREELERIAGPRLQGEAEAVADEIEKIKDDPRP
jgi:hypothetical protein